MKTQKHTAAAAQAPEGTELSKNHEGHAFSYPWAYSTATRLVYDRQTGERIVKVFVRSDASEIGAALACFPEVLHLLTLALPYVEEASADPDHKKGVVGSLVTQIRMQLAKAEGRSS